MSEPDEPSGAQGRLPKRGLAAGLTIAVGIAGLGAILMPGADEETPAATEQIAPLAQEEAPARFCHDGLITTDDRCIPADTLGEASRLTVPASFESEGLRMTGPGGAKSEETVRDCNRYAALRREGWSGVSAADMRREREAGRACGLGLILESAAVPAAMPPALRTKDWRDLPSAALPSAGEAGFGPDTVIVQEQQDPAIWSAEDARLLARFTLIGAADFNGDGQGEHLVEWGLRIKGGTLTASGFALVRNDGPRPLFQPLDPFAP